MIVIEKSGKEFNLEEIYRGTLICARHKSWPEWQSGMVSDVSEKEIRVQYLPSVAKVQNHFFIHIEDVEKEGWQIRYSSDGLISVKEYPENTTEGGKTDGSE